MLQKSDSQSDSNQCGDVSSKDEDEREDDRRITVERPEPEPWPRTRNEKWSTRTRKEELSTRTGKEEWSTRTGKEEWSKYEQSLFDPGFLFGGWTVMMMVVRLWW